MIKRNFRRIQKSLDICKVCTCRHAHTLFSVINEPVKERKCYCCDGNNEKVKNSYKMTS